MLDILPAFVHNPVMIHKVLPFLKQAGDIAIEKQDGISFHSSDIKDDNDIMKVVTDVDFEISRKFEGFVNDEFRHLNPLIVDEESSKGITIDRIKDAAWSFVIDPIDGTLTYSNGYPNYAISVGILKRGEPHMGAIYAPAMGLLTYADDKNAVSISKAFTGNEKRHYLSSDDRQAPLFINETNALLPNKNWKNKELMFIDTYAGVLKALFTVTGKARGFASFGYLWDLAGVWPIARKVGMDIRDLDTGHTLSLDDFRDKDLRVHDGTFKIMSRHRDFEYLKNILEKRNIHW